MSAPSPELSWVHGSCHCEGVKFAVSLTTHVLVTECNCRICYMSGHQEILVPNERFQLLAGGDHLKEYRFGVAIADHTFCVVCGVMPFYRPRSHPETHMSVNARCVDLGFATEIEVVQFDGRNWEQSIAAGQHRATQ